MSRVESQPAAPSIPPGGEQAVHGDDDGASENAGDPDPPVGVPRQRKHARSQNPDHVSSGEGAGRTQQISVRLSLGFVCLPQPALAGGGLAWYR